MLKPLMTIPEMESFLKTEFPQVDGDFELRELTCDGIIVALKVADRHLRPGGTVSGPSMFGLVDVAMYLAVLSRIGPVALAVTTNVSMDFMRKPANDADLVATARLLKLGKRLAVGDVLLRSEGGTDVVARAGLTYAIPPAGV